MAEETRRPLATRVEVSAFLQVPVGTLTQWAHRDIGPKYIRVGRYARYDWADVEEWVAQKQACGGH